MRDFIQFFLLCVEAFFILYMVLYSTFLFLSVAVGSSSGILTRKEVSPSRNSGPVFAKTKAATTPKSTAPAAIPPARTASFFLSRGFSLITSRRK